MATYEQILKDLQNNIYKPIYLLAGEESYYIDHITNYIANNILKEEEKQLNQTTLYGKDTNIDEIITLARKFPMMTQQQVIIIKEAQYIQNIEKLLHYAKAPQPSTMLVINYKNKTLDKRKKETKELIQIIEKQGAFLETRKLYDNKIPNWINKHLKEKGYDIEQKATILLAEHLGNDLNKIEQELRKLTITLSQNQTTITPQHIEENIGISKDFNTFELQKALGQRDIYKANQIIKFFAKNEKKHPTTLIIASLYNYFSKLFTLYFIKNKNDKRNVAATLRVSPYFIDEYYNASRNYLPKKVADIITYLRQYDMKSKGVGGGNISYYDILKEMVYKILH